MCYFNLADLASPDTGEICVIRKMIECINTLVDCLPAKVGKLRITSGYRTPEHNKKVGGARQSFHKRGMAIDCYAGMSHENLGILGLRCGFTTAIVYVSHVHLDIREKGLGLRKK